MEDDIRPVGATTGSPSQPDSADQFRPQHELDSEGDEDLFDAPFSTVARRRPVPPQHRSHPTAPFRTNVAGPRVRGQRGYGLLEVLIAIMLMGTVLAALSAAMLTLIATTSATSDQQRLQAALNSYTESLKAGTYTACGATGSPPVVYPTAAEVQEAHDGDPAAFRPAVGSGIAVAVVDVEFLSSASAAAPSGGTGTTMVNGVGEYRSVCPASGDAGRQRLTVTATLAGRAPVTGSVVVAAPQGTP